VTANLFELAKSSVAVQKPISINGNLSLGESSTEKDLKELRGRNLPSKFQHL